MDGVRLTDAQKHRLASQNEDYHSKKTFLGASSGTAQGAKKNCFVRTHEFMFFVRFSWVFQKASSPLGSTDELFSFTMVIITDFLLYNHFFYFSTLCYQSDLPFSTPRFLYTIPIPNPLLLEHISLSRPRLSCLTAPLLCWLVVASPCLSLPQHLSCIGWLLNCRLSCCITTSLVALLPLTSCRLSLVTLSLLYCAPPLLLRLSCTSDLTSAPATLVYC